MANSIDDFLSKASSEQREKFESMVKDATSGEQMSESERIAKQAKETNDISQRNDPTKGHEQAQKAPNAVDNALSGEAKTATATQGQTLAKQGVTIEKDR